MRAKQNHVFILLVLGSHSACPGEHINEVGFDSTSNTNWGLEVREEAREGLGKMRAFAWMQDLGRSTGGKIISLLLALAMIFSYSNIFVYSAKAFADENVTNEQPEGEGFGDNNSQGNDSENQNEDSDTQNGNSDTGIDIVTNTEGGTETGGDEGDTTDTENNSGDTTDPEQPEEPTEPYTFVDGVLTINNTGDLTKEIVQGFYNELKITNNDVTSIVLNNVGNIARNAFEGRGAAVASITINGAKEIAEYTFYWWGNLKSVNINNVTTIKNDAFSGCNSLESVTLTNVESLKETSNENPSRARTFGNCKNISTISLNNVGFIGREAFIHAEALTSLSINNVNEFGASPFSYCYGLTSLNLDGKANGITKLGKTMFYGCTGLESVTIKNFDSIPTQMFNGCTGIKNATISDIDTIDQIQTFYGCTGLENITLNNIKMLGSKEVLNLNMFQNCGNNISLTLSNVDYVGQQAFVSAKTIKELTLDNVGTVGVNAFASCKNIDTFIIKSAKIFNQFAFYNCTGLTTIDSLSNVTEQINGFAFYKCSNLSGLTIADIAKMGFIGSSEAIMKRVEAILSGKFQLSNAEVIEEIAPENGWEATAVNKSDNWNQYDNGTQIVQQARWADENTGTAEVKVNALYTGEKQMDYVFVADLSGSMAQLGNASDSNARFYDMQSKLLDMTGKLLNTAGYDCRVSIVSFGGNKNDAALGTCETLPFTKNAADVRSYITGLEPLNESTDYGKGFEAALNVVQSQINNDLTGKKRNTVVVFLSDGYPTVPGKDAHGVNSAKAINDLGVDIYGVLHSPLANQHDEALGIMEKTCKKVYESTDTESFGEAMNAAFTSVYGDNTITIPVNAADFDVVNIQTTAGTATLENGVITWTLHGMPFTDHQLTYDLVLKDDLANRVGTYSYAINNGGDASFNIDGGASAGVNLRLSRTVVDQTPVSTPNPGTDTTTTTTTTVVAPAAPAVTPAAAAAVTPIADDPLPMAGPTQENISDDETPMASVYDEPHCWVHILMIIGMIITAIYGAAVAIRRSSNNRNMGELERDLTEEREISYSSSHARNHA